MARLYAVTILSAMQYGSAKKIAEIIAGTSDDPDRLDTLGLLFATARETLKPSRIRAIFQAIAEHPDLIAVAKYLNDERIGNTNVSLTGKYFIVHKSIYHMAMEERPIRIHQRICEKFFTLAFILAAALIAVASFIWLSFDQAKAILKFILPPLVLYAALAIGLVTFVLLSLNNRKLKPKGGTTL